MDIFGEFFSWSFKMFFKNLKEYASQKDNISLCFTTIYLRENRSHHKVFVYQISGKESTISSA